MGFDRVLHEPGDGAIVDAVVYCAFVAAERGGYGVHAWFFPEIADERAEETALVESSGNVMVSAS